MNLNKRMLNKRPVKPIKSFTDSFDNHKPKKKHENFEQKINKFNTKFYDLVMRDKNNEPHIYVSLIFSKESFADITPFQKQGLNIYYTTGNDKDGITAISNISYSKDKYYGVLLSQVKLPITSEIVIDNESTKLYEVDMVERLNKAKMARNSIKKK